MRSLYEGEVEFFGGFSKILPTSWPGWILRTRSIYGKVRYIAIIAYQNRYGIRVLKDIPWNLWIGSHSNPPGTCLYSGDHPGEYLRLREAFNEYKHAR